MTKPKHPPVGSHVRWTRRACGVQVKTYYPDHWIGDRNIRPSTIVKLRDTAGLGDRAWTVREAARTANAARNTDGEGCPGGTYREVVIWDDVGVGVLVGLTHRHVGRVDFEDGYMIGMESNAKRVNCYQVKASLGGPTLLVPVDAVEVLAEPAPLPEPPPAPDPNQLALA